VRAKNKEDTTAGSTSVEMKRLILQQTLLKTACEDPTGHAGRAPKKPVCELREDWFGMDLLANDIRGILRKLNAPVEWDQLVGFFLLCVCDERCLSAGKFHAQSFSFAAKDRNGNWKREAFNAMLFAHMFSQAPAIFLRAMSEVGHLVQQCESSPELRVAMLHAREPKLWKQKAQGAALQLSRVLGYTVSPKVVEHARARLRAHKPI